MSTYIQRLIAELQPSCALLEEIQRTQQGKDDELCLDAWMAQEVLKKVLVRLNERLS